MLTQPKRTRPEGIFQLFNKNSKTHFGTLSKISLIFLLFSCAFGDFLFLTANESLESTIIIQILSKKSKAKTVAIENAVQTLLPKPLKDTNYYLFTYFVHNLKPNTRYTFSVDKKPFSFHTPNPEAFRFAVAGDSENNEMTKHLLKLIAHQNPAFFIMGGDIAYPNTHFFFFLPYKLIQWLETYSQTMIKDNGDLIPILGVIGNHDVKGEYDKTPKEAEVFYQLFFPKMQRSYYAFTIGSAYFLMLDTGHTQKIDAKQLEWLSSHLFNNTHFPTFIFQHVANYPSNRFFNSRSTRLRKLWTPIFDKSNVTAVFEHHDHAMKRTYPIHNQKVHKKGIVYFGDGCLGVTPRRAKNRWYIEKGWKKNGFWLVDVTPNGYKATAIGKKSVLDRYECSLSE